MLEILTLAVLVYTGAGASPEVAANARAALVEALPSNVRVVDHALDAAVAARAAGWRSVDELDFLARGRVALAAGRRARERVELDEAARLLAQAEVAFNEGLMYAGVASLAAEAALEHGVTLGDLGRADDARVAFRRAVALWPSIQLTEKTARPDVVRWFREVQKSRVAPAVLPAMPDDAVVARLEALRRAPVRDALGPLADAVAADGVLLAVASQDGRHLLVSRAQQGCMTEAVEVFPADRAKTTRALLELTRAPCAADAPLLSVDDPRLSPPAIELAPPAVVKVAPRRKLRVWPIALAGAVGVTAAILGVTIGFVTADARYAVKVDGTRFGIR